MFKLLNTMNTYCQPTAHPRPSNSLTLYKVGGCRLYYALNKDTKKAFLLFLHHKRENENPRLDFLVQKIDRALASGLTELQS